MLLCVCSASLASLSGGRVSSPHGGDVPSEISPLRPSLAALNPGGKACVHRPDYQTPRAGPPSPHHFPPPHESKSPSSPCQLTAGGKRERRARARGESWPRECVCVCVYACACIHACVCVKLNHLTSDHSGCRFLK